MGYNLANKKMKKTAFVFISLMGLGAVAMAQNNCPTGYKEVPGTNNNHTGKIVTQSNCTTTTTTKNSAQNNANVGANANVTIVGGTAGYSRNGATTTTTTQNQKCTQEKTYYYNCVENKNNANNKNNSEKK
jgi:hypothetical protein